MSVEVIVGLQRGDEGKGRFVDMMAEEANIVARFNGGNNAGHTVVLPDGRELALHLVPSGIAHPHAVNVIGNGTLINPGKLNEEIADIESKGIEVSRRNLMISSAAHLILPHHIVEDELREAGTGKQGSTKSGIAQVASFKSLRTGVRAECINNYPEELFDIAVTGLRAQSKLREAAGLDLIDETAVAKAYVESAVQLGQYVTDTVLYVNKMLANGKRVLAEGAQAFLLDIDHGMYPYTTSSSTTSGGVATGLGIPPRAIDRVTGVVKAVQSHVGGGPFVTEITDKKLLERLHGDMSTIDAEKGTTTGRVRRLGHLDLAQIRRANMVNGTDDIALSKLDWVPRYGEHVQVCIGYERKGKSIDIAPDASHKLDQSKPVYASLNTWDGDIQGVRDFTDLPGAAQRYIEFIERQLDTPIKRIGVGPQRDQVIVR